MKIYQRISFRDYVDRKRKKDNEVAMMNMTLSTFNVRPSLSECITRILSIESTAQEMLSASNQKLSLWEALDHLLILFTPANDALWCQRHAFLLPLLNDAFFQGLVVALSNGEGEPDSQLLAGDLLRTICEGIHSHIASSSISPPQNIVNSVFECLIRQTVFSLLVIISSPHLESLVYSAVWSLLFLTRSTVSLQANCATVLISRSLQWTWKLMLLDHVVEALHLQFRPLSRMNSELRRLNDTVSYQDLEDLDFDLLLPLFTLLTHTPVINSYPFRLLTYICQFNEFISALTNKLTQTDNIDPYLPAFFASTVLPSVQSYLQIFVHCPQLLSLSVLQSLVPFVLALVDLTNGLSRVAQKYVISCLVGSLQVFATFACCINEADCKQQNYLLTTVVKITCAVKSMVCWSTFSYDILLILQKIFQSTCCSIEDDLMKRIFEECVFSGYGDGAIGACYLVSAIFNTKRNDLSNKVPLIIEWLEKILSLYLQPAWCKVLNMKWDDFHIQLANAALQTVFILNYTQNLSNFIALYTVLKASGNDQLPEEISYFYQQLALQY